LARVPEARSATADGAREALFACGCYSPRAPIELRDLMRALFPGAEPGRELPTRRLSRLPEAEAPPEDRAPRPDGRAGHAHLGARPDAAAVTRTRITSGDAAAAAAAIASARRVARRKLAFAAGGVLAGAAAIFLMPRSLDPRSARREGPAKDAGVRETAKPTPPPTAPPPPAPAAPSSPARAAPPPPAPADASTGADAGTGIDAGIAAARRPHPATASPKTTAPRSPRARPRRGKPPARSPDPQAAEPASSSEEPTLLVPPRKP
jgi:hypothetical protein